GAKHDRVSTDAEGRQLQYGGRQGGAGQGDRRPWGRQIKPEGRERLRRKLARFLGISGPREPGFGRALFFAAPFPPAAIVLTSRLLRRRISVPVQRPPSTLHRSAE